MSEHSDRMQALEARLALAVEKARVELRKRGMTDREIDVALAADPRDITPDNETFRP